MNIWGRLLKLAGWKTDITVPAIDKCVICVAPHTSNWDFILGLLAYRSLGRKANFLMKGFWFFFPLKYLLTALGGIPVIRNKKKTSGQSLTRNIIEKFKTCSYMNLAVTPEGTRSAEPNWRTGFLQIATQAHVPVLLGVIDYSEKKVIIKDVYTPSGDVTKDLATIKKYYSKFSKAALYPDKFVTD